MKKISSILLLICVIAMPALAKQAFFEGSDYTISVIYNDTVSPGDAVYMRMKINFQSKRHGKSPLAASAKLSLKEREIDTTDFFQTKIKTQGNIIDMMAGIPLSTFLKAGTYSIKITYSLYSDDIMQFSLPLEIKEKNFKVQTNDFDPKNTTLKIDSSPKMMAQIDKLYKIVYNNDSDALYQLQQFQLPNAQLQKETDFGQRNENKYATGKIETAIENGTTYAVDSKTELYACGAGKIMMAEDRIATGKTVVIEHLPGLYSIYSHLDSLKVKEGEIIKIGDPVGFSGVQSKKFQWEMRLNSISVNPDFFLSDFSFSSAAGK